jgi:hypothetical protein
MVGNASHVCSCARKGSLLRRQVRKGFKNNLCEARDCAFGEDSLVQEDSQRTDATGESCYNIGSQYWQCFFYPSGELQPVQAPPLPSTSCAGSYKARARQGIPAVSNGNDFSPFRVAEPTRNPLQAAPPTSAACACNRTIANLRDWG